MIQVYFWIGEECSVDEQAVAAIKVKETWMVGFLGLYEPINVFLERDVR